MLLRLSCRIGLPARQRAGSGDLRDRATGNVLDTAPRRAAADAASPDAAARRRPRWRAAHSANLFAPVPHGHRVPVAREGEERTGRQGRARPSPSRPATPAIRRLRLADGSPLNAASYAPPVNPVLRAWSSRSWSGRARRNCWSEGSAPRVAPVAVLPGPCPAALQGPLDGADHGGGSRLRPRRPMWDPRRSSSPPWRASARILWPSRSSRPARLLP